METCENRKNNYIYIMPRRPVSLHAGWGALEAESSSSEESAPAAESSSEESAPVAESSGSSSSSEAHPLRCIVCGEEEPQVLIVRPVPFGAAETERMHYCWLCGAAQLLRYNTREWPAEGAESIQLLQMDEKEGEPAVAAVEESEPAVAAGEAAEPAMAAEEAVCTCCTRFLVCLDMETDRFLREQVCWTCGAIRFLQAHTGQVRFLSQLRCL